MLEPNEQRTRLLALALLPAGLLVLRAAPGSGLPAWLPFTTSCGAVTGLPCIFCGLTRALHFLLHGDLARALYFNWLAFPFLAAALVLELTLLLELLTGQNLLARLPRPRLSGRTLGLCLAGLLILWAFQIYLAVAGHKTELLNPAGPLYGLVARW